MVYMDMHGFEWTLFLVGWLETGVFRQWGTPVSNFK
jgi:hypothetical protein